MIQVNHGFKVLSTPGFDGWLDSLGDKSTQQADIRSAKILAQKYREDFA